MAKEDRVRPSSSWGRRQQIKLGLRMRIYSRMRYEVRWRVYCYHDKLRINGS